jgi:hypothetical protein
MVGVAMSETVRLNIQVSRETDARLRSILGSKGLRNGDRSRFIERAVRAQVFHSDVATMKSRNADDDPEELQAIIDEAVAEVRAERAVAGPRVH